jgi:nucleotide-binding universal stress UspA family protein
MDSKLRTILIPWDFTIKAEYAFAHAINVSKITQNDITLLHIIKSESDKQQSLDNLAAEAEILYKKYNVRPNILALKGTIFKTISQYANSGTTEMVIMGTHGLTTFQKLTGSWALKVIRGCRVPFLVVQDMPTNERIEKIIFPIDFKKENKEKIKWAHYLCNLYRSKIYIVHPQVTDRLFKSRIYSNIVFTKKYFDNTDINFKISVVGDKNNFAKQTIAFANEIQADLILIMTSKTLTFADYIMGPSEQYIIANSGKIPVMVVNPKPKSFAGGFSTSGG